MRLFRAISGPPSHTSGWTSSKEEAQRSEALYPFLALAAATGMRRGELLALRWRDVDFDTGVLHVRRSLSEAKSESLIEKGPKSKAGRRKIAISHVEADSLSAHRAWLQEKLLEAGGGRYPVDGLCFPVSPFEPRRHRNPRDVTHWFDGRLNRLGLQKRGRSSHSLRRTHAMQLLGAGVNVKVVSERLGHANVSITLNVYAHAMPDVQRAAADITGDVLSRIANGDGTA